MTGLDEGDDRRLPVTLERPHRCLRRLGGLGAVAQAVHDGHEPAVWRRRDQAPVTGFGLPGQDQLGDTPLEQPGAYRFHLRTVTVVPLPKSDGAQMETVSAGLRSEEHTSELQSRQYLVCRLLLEKKNDEGAIDNVARGDKLRIA